MVPSGKFSDTSENGSHKQGKRPFSSLMSSNIEKNAIISGRIQPYGGSMPDRYGQLIPADLPGFAREILPG
jgi:hypothetical protein